MRRTVAGMAIVPVLAACFMGDGDGEAANVPGYRVSVPGAFLGRFPPNPYDPEAEVLIEGASGMAIAEDGQGVFVLDQRGKQVFFLDLDANLRAVIGRPGEGPGEFEAPVSIEPDPRGGVRVVDPSLTRLSWFSPDGDLREELSTPWPVTNFGILGDGVPVYPTADQNSLLAVQSGLRHRDLEIDPSIIPSALGTRPVERLIGGALRFFAVTPDTLLMVQNRNAELFGGWRVALGDSRTRVTDVAPWPLPAWIVRGTRSGGGVVEREQQGERTRIRETVPFNSVRVVDRELWLVTGLIDDVFAASIPLVGGDSASVVLPPEGGIDCLMDAAVLGDRLVVLCEIEVRAYELVRVPADRFSRR